MCSFVKVAITRYHKQSGLNSRGLLLTALEAKSLKVSVPFEDLSHAFPLAGGNAVSSFQLYHMISVREALAVCGW